MILVAHPSWSYSDLADTPLAVLLAMDAITADARRRLEAKRGTG